MSDVYQEVPSQQLPNKPNIIHGRGYNRVTVDWFCHKRIYKSQSHELFAVLLLKTVCGKYQIQLTTQRITQYSFQTCFILLELTRRGKSQVDQDVHKG
jgi:hypothetical protein